MSKTIEELYLDYTKRIAGLENDRYFQYLYEMVQSSPNTLIQNHRVLHKVVDEQWLKTIEDSFDAINNIIDKPRSFVKTNEEVVPVSLAKKISADSVRHLSQNTQFISANDEGDVMPSRILNVTTEESYDLYENRFIYHLIQRLVRFIDKRTDVIFWSTGDETSNVVNFESHIDDAYEQIDYKIEMTIKNKQSFAENDADNMPVFMRIDRVRRMALVLRGSSFCQIMSGCASVHSPIQRTNLLMKDPDYRTCYKLWQFLEGYDEVGYWIDAQDRNLEFDEEYLIQMYTSLINNYVLFKSIIGEDMRKLDEIPPRRRKVLKPKFIRELPEPVKEVDFDIADKDPTAEKSAEELAEEEEAAKAAAEAGANAEAGAQGTAVSADVEALLAEKDQEISDLKEALDDADLSNQQMMMQMQTAMDAAADTEDELNQVKQELEDRMKEIAELKARLGEGDSNS